jgi:quercetin dioxygenase-like cupin family protein
MNHAITGVEPCVVADSGTCPEGWNEPEGRGVIGWQTLISAGLTPSKGLTAGIATLEPGGFLAPHRHAPDEIYFVLEGRALVTIDGMEREIAQGDCLFIPGMAEHGSRNVSGARVRVLYVFPVDRFEDVTYLFSDSKGDGVA